MGGESPVVELYDSNGNPLSVQNGSAIPASTPGILFMGSDGTNSRYITIDSSGRPVMVGAGTAGSPAGGVISIQGVASGTVVPISGTIAATQNGNIDAGNSSTTPLAGSGTFSGTGIDVSVYGVVSVFVFTDQAGTLNLEWSINGTNWDDVNSYTVSASTALSIQFGPQARFFRVVYQNGGTAQGTFRLQTIERPITAFPETVPASYTIQNSDNVLLTKTVQGTSPWVENITQFGGNNVVTGTGASGVGIPRVTVSNDSNVLVTQSTSPWVTNITQFGGNNVVTGTGAGGVGIPRVTVSNDSNILATQSGTWTVAQGAPNTNANKWPVQVTDGTHNMPTMDAIARAGFQEITDGTNGPVAVKAASTAAAAADPSLVTAFSPNSPLPTGTNVIGAVTQSSGPWTENLTQIAGNAVSTAATGVQKVGIVGNTGTALDGTTAGVLDENIKNVAGNAVSTAATGVQKVGIVGGTGTSLETTAGVLDHNLKNVGNAAVTTLAAGEQKVAVEGLAATGAAVSGNPVLIGGSDGTDARTINTDPQGDVYTTDFGSPSNALRGLTIGLVTGTSGVLSAVRATTYTEQTANAQRSLSSSSANDTNTAGTGARQVKITYYDQTMAGPNTETVSLNGITAVNTVGTNICFIEKMEVVSVGSNKSNVGTITLFTTTGGGGTAIGTITTGTLASGRGDNQTLWAHHYVALSKTCNITSYQGGTDANQGTIAFLMSLDPTTTTSAEKVISDIIAFSASTESITRLIRVPVRIAGPARVTQYVVPAGSNTKFTGGFDFWEL